MLRNTKGFTLIEMVIVTAVFVIVIAISGNVFKTVLQQTSKLFRSEESNIEGVVGLEIFRHDLQQAGYGLYTEPICNGGYTAEATSTPASTYNEVARTMDDPCDTLDTSVSIPANRVAPRALVAGNDMDGTVGNLLVHSDYLALKGLTLARNAASQKWTYLERSAAGVVVPKVWNSAAENFENNNAVMLMQRSVTRDGKTLTVVPKTTSQFYVRYDDSDTFKQYSTNTYQYILYGLDDDNSTVSMPFNRSDYYVSRPSTGMSPLCAPGIGNLYKATVNQGNGALTALPILDCVADMQVVFGWDLTIGNTTADGQDGLVDTWTSPDSTQRVGSATAAQVQAAMADPKQLAATLKVVKVYVLAQVGRRDPGFTSSSPILVGDTGEATITHNYTLSSDMLNYHWKVFRIVVRPKNLGSNQ